VPRVTSAVSGVTETTPVPLTLMVCIDSDVVGVPPSCADRPGLRDTIAMSAATSDVISGWVMRRSFMASSFVRATFVSFSGAFGALCTCVDGSGAAGDPFDAPDSCDARACKLVPGSVHTGRLASLPELRCWPDGVEKRSPHSRHATASANSYHSVAPEDSRVAM